MTGTLIASSVLIAAVCLLRPVLRRWVSPVAVYSLWALVAARLVLPWIYPFSKMLGALKSRLSVMNAVGAFRREVIEGSVMEPLADNLATGVVYRYDEPVPAVMQAAGIDWQLWIMVVWILGSVMLAAWMVMVNLRFLRRLQAERRAYTGVLPGFVTKRVYVVPELSSPCYFGLGSDEGIYLPEGIARDEQMVLHALAHETGHVRHGDRIWGILRCMLLCYYWMNPFVWLGAVWSRQDCELACDEAAIKLLGEEERYAYGRTLVGLIGGQGGGTGLFLASTTMTAGKHTIKDRIQTLARHPQTTASMAVVLAAVVAVLGACTFTGKSETHSTAVVSESQGVPEETLKTGTGAEEESGENQDVLVLIKQDQYGNYYEIMLQRQDGESGDPKRMLSENSRESQAVQVISYEDAKGTILSGDGSPDCGYGYAMSTSDTGGMKLNIWNIEHAGAFRVVVTDQDTVMEYLFTTSDPEPFSAYAFPRPLTRVSGFQDTSAWLKTIEEYPNALEIVLEGETEEDTIRFYNENEVCLKPIGAVQRDAYIEVSNAFRDGKEIYLLYLFQSDSPPLSQVMSIMVGEGEEPDGYAEIVLDEYQISMTARRFVTAYLSGDAETAAKYSDIPGGSLISEVKEGAPGTGTLTTRWEPEDKETYAWGTYIFYEEGQEDSVTYLEFAMKKVLGEWIVVDAWFEK